MFFIGYILGSSTNDLSMIMSITSLWVVPVIMFGGFYLNTEFVITYTHIHTYYLDTSFTNQF